MRIIVKLNTWAKVRRLSAIGCLLSFMLFAMNSTLASDAPGQASTDSQDAFSFVVWGHPRGYKDGDPQLHLDEVLERLRELKPDLLIVTGDVIVGGALSKPFYPDIRGDWERFQKAIGELDIPYYIAPGNHDINNFATRDIFLERFPKPPYAVTYKGSRFIILDSIGIDQRANDDSRYWDYNGLWFDANQLEFIRKEIALQDNYKHLFFFWHHTRFWGDASSPWWTMIHPLLIGGKTRFVFTGDPEGTYRHDNHDGIHYIVSAIVETKPIKWLMRNVETRAGWHEIGELDNIQYVQVKGDDLSIRTIVVGAMSSEGLSLRYWRKIELSWRWTQRLANKFHERFIRLRDIVLVAAIWGGVWFFLGIFASMLWIIGMKRLRGKGREAE